MRVAFRADSSTVIGTGHLMRCLVLADALKQAKGRMTFLCRDLPGHVAKLAAAAGHEVRLLPAGGPAATAAHNDITVKAFNWRDDAKASIAALATEELWDWLVVDHYSIDSNWELAVRGCARHVLVIDDLANRAHRCDVLLDQSFYEQPHQRYTDLVSDDCTLLLGPKFALLRREFLDARLRDRKRDGYVRRILVFFGGTDFTNQTATALCGAQRVVPANVALDVVVGVTNPNLSSIRAFCDSRPNACLHVQTGQMATLMESADLSLGAGGVAALERCAVSLPSIVAVVAENQLESMRDLARRGAILLAGASPDVDERTYAERIDFALHNPTVLRKLSAMAGEIMNGCEEGTRACVDTMLGRLAHA